MSGTCRAKRIKPQGHEAYSNIPSDCATQGTVPEDTLTPSSLSQSECHYICNWHNITDCSFHQWCTGASDHEKKCVARFLGKVTAGKETFERQLREALQNPPADPTVGPHQDIRLVYENTEAVGKTIRKPWRPDYVIDPNMMSENIAVRPKLNNWPIPPSRALH